MTVINEILLENCLFNEEKLKLFKIKVEFFLNNFHEKKRLFFC